MLNGNKQIRVLYSFPHKLGAERICSTAWHQVRGLADAGADVLVCPGVVHKPLPSSIRVSPTLARGNLRIPYKAIGKMRALALHDYIVARRLERISRQIDIVHCWPVGSLRTLKVAARLGIPTVLERPNAHTRYAYEAVREECRRMDIILPPGHEYDYNETILRKEEEEYRLAYRLLCPSDFVVRTFIDQGVDKERLVRHRYGFDDKVYYADSEPRDSRRGLTMLFAGVAAVRKGVHFALEAWLKSSAHHDGCFLIAGEFLPAYHERLAPLLSHPSVRVLGHRRDLPELMRRSDLLVLSSIEEGSALVTFEARGSGCVLLVSDAAGAECTHMETGLVHRTRDVGTLSRQISTLHEDRALLQRLRTASLQSASDITWRSAGVRLLDVYRETIAAYRRGAQESMQTPELAHSASGHSYKLAY